MKRLLTILSEVFLFCFLLVILITPVIVSLNLDPELLEYDKNVAGVSDIKSDGTNFIVNENFRDVDEIQFQTSDQINNVYSVDFTILRQTEFDKVYDLFELSTQSEANQKFVVKIFSDDSLNGVKVFLIADSNEGLLFDGEDFHEVTFSQEADVKSQVGLKFVANSELNFEIPIRLELRGVKSSS